MLKGHKPPPRTESHKLNLRLSKMGRRNPNYGVIYSQEYKDKMSNLLKGRIFSAEHKARLSARAKERKLDRNANWKGGRCKNPVIERIRKSDMYGQWRQGVFIRDRFACKRCGTKGIIHAHHVKGFHGIIKEIKTYLPLLDLFSAAMIYAPMWDIDNGVTLCEACHKEEHRMSKKPTKTISSI